MDEEVTVRDVTVKMFSVLSLLTKRRGQPVGEELRRQEWVCSVEEALRQVQPEDASEPHCSVARRRQAEGRSRTCGEAGKAIDAWESKVVDGEEPTTGLKASLLLEMLPDQVQLTVAQGLSSKKLDNDTLKANIKLVANVQSYYSTPQPMDFGEMECHVDNEDVEAVAIQKGKGEGLSYGSCWTCGGNHSARVMSEG